MKEYVGDKGHGIISVEKKYNGRWLFLEPPCLIGVISATQVGSISGSMPITNELGKHPSHLHGCAKGCIHSLQLQCNMP